jgi:hypothetical protein
MRYIAEEAIVFKLTNYNVDGTRVNSVEYVEKKPESDSAWTKVEKLKVMKIYDDHTRTSFYAKELPVTTLSKAEIKARALAKLSPEEREALGV